MLIILVLGGYGRLYGAFVGAVAYMVLAHFLSKLYPTAWQLGLGLMLVIIALFFRGGILGMGDAITGWLRGSAQRQDRRHDHAARNARRQQELRRARRRRPTSTSSWKAARATR